MSDVTPKCPLKFSGKIAIIRDKLIGKGVYGMVFAGTYDDEGKKSNVAVKRIELNHVDVREVDVQIQLRHENVVSILAVEEDDDFRYIVLELCAGSLQHVFQNKYTGPLPSAAEVLYQIANGLGYIHSQKMIHRDIKPDNILISNKEGEEGVLIKISDFGMSKEITDGVYAMSGKRGTYSWMAPEVQRWCLSNEDQNLENSFTPASDIFCAGCVFFTYVADENKHPFGESEIDRAYNISVDNIINRESLPNDHFAASIIREMIKHEPEDRISLEIVKQTLEPYLT